MPYYLLNHQVTEAFMEEGFLATLLWANTVIVRMLGRWGGVCDSRGRAPCWGRNDSRLQPAVAMLEFGQGL